MELRIGFLGGVIRIVQTELSDLGLGIRRCRLAACDWVVWWARFFVQWLAAARKQRRKEGGGRIGGIQMAESWTRPTETLGMRVRVETWTRAGREASFERNEITGSRS